MKSIMPYEIWKPVKGYEGLYSVSNIGRVRSEDRYVKTKYGVRISRGRILRPYDNGGGYLAVQFNVNRVRDVRYVHRLVAGAFVDNPTNRPEVNHLDYDRKNNRADNLEWCTDQENTRYSSVHMHNRKGGEPRTNTGERYISMRKCRAEYRLTLIGYKEMRFKTLEDAVRKRKELIGE